MSASQVAQHILQNTSKRLATLEKSLAKKKKALQVQEELFQSEPQKSLEDHPTYQYYLKELEAAEAAYEKKCRYYNEQIDALKNKLRAPEPTGKVYRRLKAEVEMEQREYDELKKEYQQSANAYSTVVVPQELEKMRKATLAAEAARKRQEEQELLEQREAAVAARKAREAADEARQLAELEAAQKAQKVEETPSRAPEKKEPPKTDSIPSALFQSALYNRIKFATCMKDLEDLSTEKMSAAEEQLWEERYDFFGEQEMRAKEEQSNSIVSDPAPEVPEIDEQKIEAALQASIAQDMEAQDRIIATLTFEESRELSRRLSAHYSKPKAAPKVAPLGSFNPVAQTTEGGFPPILKTTKKFVVRQSGQPAPPGGSIRR